jgi:hypothetical protein
MNNDPARDNTTTFRYEPCELTDVTRKESPAALMARLAEQLNPPAPPEFAFEHDAAQGVFRLRWPAGGTEVFRDKPVRYLSVEPDETGAMRPVTRFGRPVYLYLARAEREVR